MPERMRVLTVVNALALAGAEKFGCELAMSLSSQFEVQLVALRDVNLSQAEQLRARLTDAGIRCYELHKKPGPSPKTLLQLRRLVRRFRPHVLHTHSTSSDFYGGLLARANPKIKWVSTLHNKLVWPRFERLGRPIDRTLFRRADAVVGISKQTIDWAKQTYALPQEAFHVVLSAVDVNKFQHANSDKETTRRQYDVPADAIWAVMVGNRSPFKGVDVAIEAIKSLEQSERSTLWVTSIGGEHIDPAYSETLRKTLKQQPLLPVQLRPPSGDIPSVLQAADLFIMPSRMEGLPVALLEAQAAGLACVATSVGAIGEVIEDGVNGLLVPPDSPAALCAALSRLVNDTKLRKQLASNATEAAEQRFTHERMAKQYTKLFEALI